MTSERRAAAARANGAKSRGPVTAQGKANSARNSFRHGLRARILFNDGKFEPERQSLIASLVRELNPQTEIERRLVEIVAEAHWARIRLWQLETDLLNAEMRRLNCPAAHAFRSLSDQTCALELLARFESRYSRLYDRALDRFRRLQSGRFPGTTNSFFDERTQQVIENKERALQIVNVAQRPTDLARHSFVDHPTEIPAKCAQAL